MTSIPKRSPWGQVDGATILAPGIVSVSTPSHGGLHLDREHVATMRRLFPNCPRLNSPWFEEDCDWGVPFAVFAGEILKHLQQGAPSWELDHFASNLQMANQTWQRHHAAAWAQFHNNASAMVAIGGAA